MSKRKIQEMFEEVRKLSREEEEANEGIKVAQEEIKELEATVQESKRRKCEVEMKLLGLTDLMKEGKIKLVAMSLKDYLALDNCNLIFYVYTTESDRTMGIMEGEDLLTPEESNHFEEYKKDYFYYGEPWYVDTDELTECEMAFEGDFSLTEHQLNDF